MNVTQPPTPEQVAALAVPSLLAHRAGEMLAVASFAWFLWDWFTTIDEEVRYIWSRPLVTTLKVLFYINRYFMLFMLVIHAVVIFGQNINIHLCDAANDLFAYGTVVNVGVTEVMIMLRLYALYQKDKRILAFFILLYGTALVVTIVVLTIGIKASSEEITPFPSLVSCARKLPTYFGSPFLVTLVDQTIFFIMTFSKSYQHVKSRAKTPILSALVREGLIFYIISLWSIAFMITGAFLGPLDAAAYGSLFVNVAFSVTGSRLTLSMRAIYTTSDDPTSMYTKNGVTRATTADLPEFVLPDDEPEPPDDVIPLRSMGV